MRRSLDRGRARAVITESYHVRTLRIGGFDRVLIGRHPTCTIVLGGKAASRRHCVLTWHRGILMLEDLKSSNGTFVNGKPFTAGPVWEGDFVQVGAARISFDSEGGDKDPAAPEAPSHEGDRPFAGEATETVIRTAIDPDQLG